MPLPRVFHRIVTALAMLVAGGCETAFAPPVPYSAAATEARDSAATAEPQPTSSGGTVRAPRELLRADMVIQRVEEGVARDEVAAVVSQLLGNARACTQMPAIWLSSPERAGRFMVRFDLMLRDWGESSTLGAQARMDEFVAMGFLTARQATEIGAGAVEYTLTREGRLYLRGAIDSGQRPEFCAPMERRLVEITSMERGQYPCGTLRVRFTHIADAWPFWARTETSRSRLVQTWPAVGELGYGEVSLSRQWFRVGAVPRGVTNGALVSACLDESRQRVIADDLNLVAAPQ